MGRRRRRRRGEIRPTSMAPLRHVPSLVDDLVEEILLRNPPDDPAGEIRPTIMAPPRQVSALADDLIEEILIRCPPDDPAVLARVAVVCKDWRRVVSGPGFRRRFCERHRTAPMLGFFYYGGTPFRFEFEPTTSFRPRYAGVDIGVQSALDARHGRVLLSRFSSLSSSSSASVREELVVWDPVRSDLQVLPMPRLRYTCSSWTAAFHCAAAGCDHLDCAHGPFLVVFVGTKGTNNVESSVCACFYSSVQGEWSEPTSGHHSREDLMGNGPGALVGNAFYFLFQLATGIVKYDLGTGEVSVIHLDLSFYKRKMIVLTAAEEGQLGLASITYGSRLVVWTREASSNRDFAWLHFWVQTRVIELKALLPAEAFLVAPKVVGLADGVGVVIVRTHNGGLFTIDIKSSHVSKIGNGLPNHDVIAYMNFHTPVLQTASSGVGPRLCGSTASQTDGAQ